MDCNYIVLVGKFIVYMSKAWAWPLSILIIGWHATNQFIARKRG